MKNNNRLLAGLAACAVMTLVPTASAQYPSGQTGQSGTRSGQTGSTTTRQEERTERQSGAKATANRVMRTESTFLTKAIEADMAEVDLGNLAKERGSSDAVKNFGQRMVDDHGRNLTEVKQIASEKGVTAPDKLNAKDTATKDRLSKLSGAAFDRAYINDMVNDHRMDIREFEQQSKTGTDPDVKAYAAKTLPVLQEHLKMAESARAQVGGTRSGESNREQMKNNKNMNGTMGTTEDKRNK